MLETMVCEEKRDIVAVLEGQFEDAFDEIEILSFPVSCSPFDLLQTKFRSTVVAKNLNHFVNKEVKQTIPSQN